MSSIKLLKITFNPFNFVRLIQDLGNHLLSALLVHVLRVSLKKHLLLVYLRNVL